MWDSCFPALSPEGCHLLVAPNELGEVRQTLKTLLKGLKIAKWKPTSLFNNKKGYVGQGLPWMGLGFTGESWNMLVMESGRGFA